MIVVLLIALFVGGVAYQAEKPCDDKCFQQKVTEAAEQTRRESAERRADRLSAHDL